MRLSRWGNQAENFDLSSAEVASRMLTIFEHHSLVLLSESSRISRVCSLKLEDNEAKNKKLFDTTKNFLVCILLPAPKLEHTRKCEQIGSTISSRHHTAAVSTFKPFILTLHECDGNKLIPISDCCYRLHQHPALAAARLKLSRFLLQSFSKSLKPVEPVHLPHAAA